MAIDIVHPLLTIDKPHLRLVTTVYHASLVQAGQRDRLGRRAAARQVPAACPGHCAEGSEGPGGEGSGDAGGSGGAVILYIYG